MKKQILIFFVFLITLSGFAQDFEKAKLLFSNSQKAYDNDEYEKAIKLIGEVKNILNGNTNPDIIFLEANIRYARDINLLKTQELFNNFIKEAEKKDIRREIALKQIIKLSKPSYLYNNGNRLFRELNHSKKIDADFDSCDLYWELFNKNGQTLGYILKGTKDFSGNIFQGFKIIFNNPNNYEENLQTQYYARQDYIVNSSWAGGAICTLLSHKGNEILNLDYYDNFNKASKAFYKREVNKDDIMAASIIKDFKYRDNSIPEKLKNYLNKSLEIDLDKIGIITSFKFFQTGSYKEKRNYTYEFINQFQDFIKMNNKNTYKFNFKNNEWKKTKKQ